MALKRRTELWEGHAGKCGDSTNRPLQKSSKVIGLEYIPQHSQGHSRGVVSSGGSQQTHCRKKQTSPGSGTLMSLERRKNCDVILTGDTVT